MKKYYPHGNNPLHEVRDWSKVRSMIRALRQGEKLPLVYCDGPLGGGNWLSGTHRVAASEIRAVLDGTVPYEDIDVFDISEWVGRLGHPDFFWDIWNNDSEEACSLLDAASNFDEFQEALVLALRQ